MRTIAHTIHCMGRTCRAEFHEDDGLALQIRYLWPEGGSLGWLTMKAPSDQLADDEFIVKNYSQYKPIIDAAMASGVFVNTGRTLRLSHLDWPIWKFKI